MSPRRRTSVAGRLITFYFRPVLWLLARWLARRLGVNARQRQRGASLVMTAIFLFILLLFCGLALDYGRAYLLRAQLQTAVDAAVLAGALQAEPWVEIVVRRWRWRQVWEYCWDPEREEWYRCGYHWERRRADVTLEGNENALLYREEWRELVDCSWPYQCLEPPEVTREWIILPDDAGDWARQAFLRNADWPDGPGGVNLRELWFGTNPDAGAVMARARAALPTTLLRLVGIGEVEVVRQAEAEPFRYDKRR